MSGSRKTAKTVLLVCCSWPASPACPLASEVEMLMKNLQYAAQSGVHDPIEKLAIFAIVASIHPDGYSRFDLHDLSDLLGLNVPDTDKVLSSLHSSKLINAVYYDKLLNVTIAIDRFLPTERLARGKVPKGLRKETLENDGYECVVCGARDRLEADHIIPVARGGSDVISNMQTLCKTCNSSKGSKTMNEWLHATGRSNV